MQVTIKVIALFALCVVVSMINAVPLPISGSKDTPSLVERADILRPNTGNFLEEQVLIEGLPANPDMNRVAAEAHDTLNAASIISPDGSKLRITSLCVFMLFLT